MKNVVLLMCMAFMVMGCSTPVKAIPARGGQVVVVERHRHKKPKKVVVVLGTRVKARPAKSVVIYYNRKPYLYADGIYYKSVGREYEVIKPQIGMIVPELPKRGVKKIRIKGEVLYSYDNVLYKKIVTSEGVQFEVRGFVDD